MSVGYQNVGEWFRRKSDGSKFRLMRLDLHNGGAYIEGATGRGSISVVRLESDYDYLGGAQTCPTCGGTGHVTADQLPAKDQP